MKWKCPACGSEDNSSDMLRCACGEEVIDNARYVVEDAPDEADESEPPATCPQCGNRKFQRLLPEKGTEHTAMTLFGFLLDFFSPGPWRSHGLEISNMGRPGWICVTCGFEI